jgi:hypothetical protein
MRLYNCKRYYSRKSYSRNLSVLQFSETSRSTFFGIPLGTSALISNVIQTFPPRIEARRCTTSWLIALALPRAARVYVDDPVKAPGKVSDRFGCNRGD